jgi:hypothetical protein
MLKAALPGHFRQPRIDRLHFGMGADCEEHEHEGAEQGKQSAARADQDGASPHLTAPIRTERRRI